MANLNKALNEIRAGGSQASQARRLPRKCSSTDQNTVSRKKNPENLTEAEGPVLDEVMQYDLKSVKAYLLKEAPSRSSWSYRSPLLGALVSEEGRC